MVTDRLLHPISHSKGGFVHRHLAAKLGDVLGDRRKTNELISALNDIVHKPYVYDENVSELTTSADCWRAI
jgi:hypothetical protein